MGHLQHLLNIGVRRCLGENLFDPPEERNVVGSRCALSDYRPYLAAHTDALAAVSVGMHEHANLYEKVADELEASVANLEH